MAQITGGGGGGLVEYATPANFPATGAAAVIYIATDTGRTYRWAGTAYMELGPIGGNGDTVLRSLLVPPAPTNLAVVSGNASVALSWTAPTVLAQTPITDYTEQYSADNGANWTTFTQAASATPSATVTGLNNGTAYVFRVAAVNAVGVGTYTAASSAVTPSAASLTLVRQGSYGVSGAGTSASPWRVTTTAVSGDIPTWRVTGTLTVRFAFQAHERDDDGFGPSNEFVYRTATDPTLQKNDGRSVATLGAVLVESGRNKTVNVTLSDCFFYMRRQNNYWGPHADGGSQQEEGRPSVQFFVP
jgi:hypothetical protein